MSQRELIFVEQKTVFVLAYSKLFGCGKKIRPLCQSCSYFECSDFASWNIVPISMYSGSKHCNLNAVYLHLWTECSYNTKMKTVSELLWLVLSECSKKHLKQQHDFYTLFDLTTFCLPNLLECSFYLETKFQQIQFFININTSFRFLLFEARSWQSPFTMWLACNIEFL